MLVGLKDFTTGSGPAVTFSVALEVLPTPKLVSLTVTTLFHAPGATPFTFIVIVQNCVMPWPLAGGEGAPTLPINWEPRRVAFVRLNDEPSGAALNVPV